MDLGDEMGCTLRHRGAASSWRPIMADIGAKQMLAPDRRFVIGLRSLLVSLLSSLGHSTRTKPILDTQGRAVAGSIAALEPVTLGGVRQWVLVRGRSAESPLLLKLHGGPGQAEMATAGLNGFLEADFVVIEWDQRGAGKSGASIQPAAAMNIGQLVADTIEVTEYLTQRF